MNKIILLALVIGLIVNLVRVFIQKMKVDSCPHCKDKGY